MSDKRIDEYCKDWMRWCETRKFYMGPNAKNILARLQPHTVNQAPDAKIDPDMQYFNMAIRALSDMDEYEKAFLCFWAVYIDDSSNIKRNAYEMEVSRSTYYNRATSFAKRALSMSASLKKSAELNIPECQTDDN